MALRRTQTLWQMVRKSPKKDRGMTTSETRQVDRGKQVACLLRSARDRCVQVGIAVQVLDHSLANTSADNKRLWGEPMVGESFRGNVRPSLL